MLSDSQRAEYVKAFTKIGEFIGLVAVSWLDGVGELPAGPVVEANGIDTLLTQAQAAKILRVSLNTFRTFERRGLVRRVPSLGERTVRYRPGDVEKLKNRKRE
jgi:hypothetical protein